MLTKISYNWLHIFVSILVCSQSQHMKHFQTSFIIHSKITNDLWNPSCHVQISQLHIMLERYIHVLVNILLLNNVKFYVFLLIVPLLFYKFQVQYQSNQFLDKNKDYVVPEHQDLLGSSRCAFVAGLFPPVCEESPKSSKFSSIGSRFKVFFFLIRVNYRK